jgi:hypothetical protein
VPAGAVAFVASHCKRSLATTFAAGCHISTRSTTFVAWVGNGLLEVSGSIALHALLPKPRTNSLARKTLLSRALKPSGSLASTTNPRMSTVTSTRTALKRLIALSLTGEACPEAVDRAD